MLTRPELLFCPPWQFPSTRSVPCWLWFTSECDYDSVQTRSGPRHGVSSTACEAPSVSPHQLSVAPIYSTVGRKIKPPTPTFAEENYLVNSITQRGESWEVTLYSLQCQGRQSLQTNLIYPVIAGLLRALSRVTSCGLPRVKHFKFNYQNVAPQYNPLCLCCKLPQFNSGIELALLFQSSRTATIS